MALRYMINSSTNNVVERERLGYLTSTSSQEVWRAEVLIPTTTMAINQIIEDKFINLVEDLPVKIVFSHLCICQNTYAWEEYNSDNSDNSDNGRGVPGRTGTPLTGTSLTGIWIDNSCDHSGRREVGS